MRWSVDTAGPFPTFKHHGRTHLLVWVEHSSRSIWSRPLSHLRDMPLAIAEWADMCGQSRRGPKKSATSSQMALSACTGMGLHVSSAKVQKQRPAREKINWTNSPPHQQWRNAHAERAMQTLMQHTKAVLHGGDMPQENWPEAAAFATLVHNDFPRLANDEDRAPNEARTGQKSPDIMGVCLPSGARATAHMPAQQRDGKLGRVARAALVLGWDTTASAPMTEVTTKTGRSMLRVSNGSSVDPLLPSTVYEIPGKKLPENATTWAKTSVERAHVAAHSPQVNRENDASAPWVIPVEAESEESEDEQPKGSAVPEVGETEVFDDNHVAYALNSTRDKTRPSLSAQVGAHPQRWKAMPKGTEDEVNGLVARCLVPVSEETVDIDHVATLISMWTVKRDVAGEINRFKCRSVCPGQNERAGEDHWLSRSDVPKVTSTRIHLALSPLPEEENRTFDVDQAYNARRTRRARACERQETRQIQ